MDQAKHVVYVDMDDVLCDYSGASNQRKRQNPSIAFPQSQYGFYAELAPIDGAINGICLLSEITNMDVYILTAPSLLNPLCYTEKRVWVEKHLGMQFVERLIISPDKSLLSGDYLIDDKASGNGQDRFSGKLIQFGSTDFPDWFAVNEFLAKLE